MNNIVHFLFINFEHKFSRNVRKVKSVEFAVNHRPKSIEFQFVSVHVANVHFLSFFYYKLNTPLPFLHVWLQNSWRKRQKCKKKTKMLKKAEKRANKFISRLIFWIEKNRKFQKKSNNYLKNLTNIWKHKVVFYEITMLSIRSLCNLKII